MFAGQIILGYSAKYLGDYLWLSTLLSHTSNPVPLRAGICWPCYLRLDGTWLEEEISKTGRAFLAASANPVRGDPLLRACSFAQRAKDKAEEGESVPETSVKGQV